MTSINPERQTLPTRLIQMRSIQRNQVRQRLAIAAVVALLISSCGKNSSSPTGQNAVSGQNANKETPAVFYKTTEECEADAQKQQDEYVVLKSAFDGGKLAAKPTPPPIKQDDCKPQMLAAQQMYQQSAPTYASLAECQAQGLECEPSTAARTGYYQPRFGGSYFYPFGGRTEYIYVNYQGSQRRLYQPSLVYQSSTPGQVVTPSGQVVTTKTTAPVSAPRSNTVASPPRPVGTPATGAVTGRSSTGFGSTYKSTGSGGK